MTITLSAKKVWRNYVTDGDSGSGAHAPIKSDIQIWGQEVEQRQFDTRTLFIADTMLAGVSAVRTHGYAAAGDGGGAFYKRVGGDPTPALGFQSADATWWELVPEHGKISVLQAGAVRDNSTDDAAAINAAAAACVGTAGLGFTLVFPQGKYKVVSTLDLMQVRRIEGLGEIRSTITSGSGVKIGTESNDNSDMDDVSIELVVENTRPKATLQQLTHPRP